MHLKNQIRIEYTVMRWHHFKQKPLLNAHKMFLTIQGLLNLQRHWIRNDQSRNDYRGVSISAGGKIKSREKIILKIFFVNLSLLLECTYFMDQTNYGWTSREQSNFRLNFETFRWVLWAMLFLLFFPSFLESWKRVNSVLHWPTTDFNYQVEFYYTRSRKRTTMLQLKQSVLIEDFSRFSQQVIIVQVV